MDTLELTFDRIISFTKPNSNIWSWPNKDLPYPSSPFESAQWNDLYEFFLQSKVPITIAITYFTSVHLINGYVLKRQVKKAKKADPKFDESKMTDKQIKKLPAAAFGISKTGIFKLFVLLHNIFLCVYSAWTFVGMVKTIHDNSYDILPKSDQLLNLNFQKFELFWSSICDLDNGVFSASIPKNLNFFGFWFYLSKFYEVLDTIIILLKGRQSSLLQSYHHAGAMMCMWAGIRYQSPPIWIFVVFNSFIHTLMYFYFTLSCLHIRVPTIFKRVLTSMQITQFVLGGSLAVFHLFVEYRDLTTGTFKSCIADANQALPLFINVAYLTPLTALFAAFYIESYVKRSPIVKA